MEDREGSSALSPPRLKADDARVGPQMREALRGIRFGRLTVVVQDGIIVQVERTEKVRLPRDKP